MAVGIIDLDLLFETKYYMLNLDVMQISAYHKKQKEKVVLCRTADKEELEWFSTLYIVYNGEEELPIDYLINDTRSILVGKYFYHNYLSLPREIYDMYPDKTIYDKLLSSDYLSNFKLKNLKNLYRNADFIRLHLSTNLSFISNSSARLVCYDQDVIERDLVELVKLNKNFSFYFPISIHNLQQTKTWLENTKLTQLGSKRLFSGYFTNEELNSLLQIDAEQSKQYIINFGNCNPSNYNAELKKMLNFVYEAKDKQLKFKLNIIRISNSNYSFLFNIIKRWYELPTNREKTIFEIFFKTLDQLKFGQKIKAFDPELFKMLNLTYDQRRNYGR